MTKWSSEQPRRIAIGLSGPSAAVPAVTKCAAQAKLEGFGMAAHNGPVYLNTARDCAARRTCKAGRSIRRSEGLRAFTKA